MKRLLYVFDDINYPSGAKAAMLYQMKLLQKQFQVYGFSLTQPKEQIGNNEVDTIPFLGQEYWDLGKSLTMSIKTVMKSRLPLKFKLYRLGYSLTRFGTVGEPLFEKLYYRKLLSKFETYDAVIVISEASKLRTMVSRLSHPKKIQWIHTDYERWSEFSSWTRTTTNRDRRLYQHFDQIVVLSELCLEGLKRKLGETAERAVVIPNLIQGEQILKASEDKPKIETESQFSLVTVGRLEKEKAPERMVRIARRLKNEGISFQWYWIGDGTQWGYLKKLVKNEVLEKEIRLTGRLQNPYPLMKSCHCFVLVSEYEGRPITIDEAMVLGLPVIAPDVGGIREQLTEWGSGTVAGGEDELYQKIKDRIQGKFDSETETKKRDYREINQDVMKKIIDIFL